MILPKELLQKYKTYLISLDYPFIKQKNDADIQKLFEEENRTLLLSWLIKKYLPSFSDKVAEAQRDDKIESLLINIMYENGFCRLEEREPFVKATLKEEKQIVIFNTIFHMISLLNVCNSTEEKLDEEDLKLKTIFSKSTEELKKEIIPDSNLLKELDLPKKLTEAERKKKIDSFKEQIEDLKNIIELKEKETKQFTNENSLNVATEDLEKLINDFKKHTTDFNYDDFVKFTNNKTGTVVSSSKTELENYVSVNSREVKSLLKSLQKKIDLNKFSHDENTGTNLNIPSEDDFSSCVLQNYVLSNKIFEEACNNPN